MGKLILILAVLGVGVAVWMFGKSGDTPKVPYLDPEEWWGPNELKGKQDTSIRPFQVKFSEEMIKDLKYRLKNHRPFTPPLEGVGFQYGFNGAQLDTWVNYWADKYPFAEREKLFNKFPHFKTNIQGLDIHFIRVKPQVPENVKVLPLIMLVGWPGSVREFYDVIPLLTRQTEGYDFVFELIVPSLPGCGFSDGAVRPGLGGEQIAVVMRNLMQRLGFNKYYIQGGNWGGLIVAHMATLYPDEILGQHSNLGFIVNSGAIKKTIIGAFLPSLVVEPHSADRMYPLSNLFAWMMEEFGYMHIHATKPDTIGVALADSPAGLLAYTLEKFSTWTNNDYRSLPDGGLLTSGKFTKDQLIDILMMYWSTNSVTNCIRIYANTFSIKNMELKLDEYETPVPAWFIQSKHEPFYQPPSILKIKHVNLINTTVIGEGGHFLAFELPKVFAADVFKAVKAFREWHEQNKKTEL